RGRRILDLRRQRRRRLAGGSAAIPDPHSDEPIGRPLRAPLRRLIGGGPTPRSMNPLPPILEYSQPPHRPWWDRFWGIVFALCSVISGVLGGIGIVGGAIFYFAPQAMGQKQRLPIWAAVIGMIMYCGVLWLSLVAARLAKRRFRQLK